MIKLFAGEDTYESYIAAFKHAKKLSDQKKIPIKALNSDEITNVQAFQVEIEGVGMFVESNIIFLKRLDQNKKLLDYFNTNLEKLNNEYDIVIWLDRKEDGKTKLIKDLKKLNGINNFALPKPWQMNNWVKSISMAKDINLSDTQINYLIERIGVNKWIIINEIKKIELYLISQSKNNLTNEELSKVLGFDVKGDIWKFLDFYAEKNFQKALEEFQKIVKFENNTQYLLAMIERELANIVKVKLSKELNKDVKELKLHPFVLQKTIKKAKNFSTQQLKQQLQSLSNLDYNIKSGKMDENLSMFMFLLP